MEKKSILDILIGGQPGDLELAKKRDDIEAQIEKLENPTESSEMPFNTYYGQQKTCEESAKLKKDLKKANEQSAKLKNDLKKTQEENEALREKLVGAEKMVTVSDAFAFLQCEAAALEDLLID